MGDSQLTNRCELPFDLHKYLEPLLTTQISPRLFCNYLQLALGLY